MAHKKPLVRSTSAQINLFVDYMSANRDFANGVGEYAGVLGAKKANVEWEELREQLKQHGTDKSAMQWKQSWRDLKRKARKAVSDSKSQTPVLSDIICKVLEIIGTVNQDSPMETQKTETTQSEVDDWAVETQDNSVLLENENDKNEDDMEKESTKSSEGEDSESRDSVVEVIVPLPQIREVYSSGSTNKALHDPLQPPAPHLPRLPRLAPKPPPLPMHAAAFCPYPSASQSSPTTSHSHTHSTSPSNNRLRQILMTRKRKAQNMIQQASNDFVSLEQRRLKMEEERDRRLHEREMERLKLELQRIEVQRNHNELLQHLVNIAQNAYELLQQKLQ